MIVSFWVERQVRKNYLLIRTEERGQERLSINLKNCKLRNFPLLNGVMRSKPLIQLLRITPTTKSSFKRLTNQFEKLFRKQKATGLESE